MRLDFERYNAGYSYLNGSQNMIISKLDLCRHTMQVGYKNRHLYRRASWFKHLEMFFMVLANVDEYAGELILKKEYFNLDQSEKVCVSYQIGQGLTRAVAERYLNIPWVTHFKTMKSMGFHFTSGGSAKIIIKAGVTKGIEPDLIGYDISGLPHLLESKGSSYRNTNDDTIQKAINQVSQIVDIHRGGLAQPFITRSACIFNFTDYFHGMIIDPPLNGDDNHEGISIGLLPCIYDYYNDFFKENNNLTLESHTIMKRDWKGYIFSFNNEQYFWGLDSLYIDFLEKHIFSKPELIERDRYWWSDSLYMHQENYDGKIEKEILTFFKEQESNPQIKQEYYTSIGKDGFILCKI